LAWNNPISLHERRSMLARGSQHRLYLAGVAVIVGLAIIVAIELLQ
jgi:hypothetical protein